MNNKARAKICGVLGKDVKIKESKKGKKYGIITIAVNKVTNSEANKPILKTHWFTVLIWNLNLLKRYSSYLTKGTNIIAEGELEVVPEGGDYLVGQNKVHMIIAIKSKSGITILAKLPIKYEEKNTSCISNDYKKIGTNGIIDAAIIESIRR